MKEEKLYRTKEALELINISPRRLALWENTFELFEIKRVPGSLNRDRVFSRNDIELIKWIKQQMDDKGRSVETVRLLIEYYTKGKITSVKWYK